MRIAWLELPHYSEGYYDALQEPLKQLGHTVSEVRPDKAAAKGETFSSRALEGIDLALVGFGWFFREKESARSLPEFQQGGCSGTPTQHAPCYCGAVPLVVILNKEYTALAEKMEWIRSHCVAAAFTAHHGAPLYAQQTGVPFHRIWFGVDVSQFAHRAWDGPPRYEYDLGFTGVIREDQTANWRRRIWKQAWPRLAERGLRLFSGGEGGANAGIRHKVWDAAALSTPAFVPAASFHRLTVYRKEQNRNP